MKPKSQFFMTQLKCVCPVVSSESFGSVSNLLVEEMGCFGCCDKKTVNYMCKGCPIRICASKKEIENCGWCDNFPCEKLNFISEKTMDFLKSINNKKNLK